MPDNRVQGIVGGFSAGTRLGDVRVGQERNQLFREQQENEQKQIVRTDFFTKMKENLSIMQGINKDSTPGIFTDEELGKEQDKRGNRNAYDSAVQTAWEDMLPAINMAVENAVISPEEAQIIRKQYEISTTLTDPRPAQDLAAAGKGANAQAVAEGQLPSQLALERQRAVTRGTPTSQNINQVTAQAPQPGAEKVEPIGMQLMEDVRQSTGIVAGISKGLSQIFGQFVPGTNQRLEAAQRIKNWNQEFKFALSRNPKYPVAEMKAIEKDMLIDADAWLVDPEAEARKVIILKDSLEKWNEADRISLPTLTADKAEEVMERMGTRDTFINLIGEVPTLGESNDQEIESLQEKVVSGTATDDEKRRYIELDSQ